MKKTKNKSKQAPPDAKSEPAPEDGGTDVSTTEAAAAEAVELHDKWLRALAELENVRRRARLDLEQALRFGSEQLLLTMLPVLDNLQRALSHPSRDVPEDFLEGLRLIEQQWLDALRKHGVTPISAEPGTMPDPALHRVLMEHDSEDVACGTITTELLRGYRLHDRLLRDAQVAVARSPSPADADEDQDAGENTDAETDTDDKE